MSDIGSIGNLAGANSAQARNAGARATPPEPATVQQAVTRPLTTPQNAVTQSPAAGKVEWKRHADPDGQQHNPRTGTDRQQFMDTVEHFNHRLRDFNINLRFEVDDQYHEIVVRIVDRETQEVLRQIPSEKALALAKFFEEQEIQQSQEPPGNNHADGKESERLKLEGWLLRATV